jgi:hypothetical protein
MGLAADAEVADVAVFALVKLPAELLNPTLQETAK